MDKVNTSDRNLSLEQVPDPFTGRPAIIFRDVDTTKSIMNNLIDPPLEKVPTCCNIKAMHCVLTTKDLPDPKSIEEFKEKIVLPETGIFEEYPLAVDGAICSICGKSFAPIKLDEDCVSFMLSAGVQYSRDKIFNYAEYLIRRVIASCPNSSKARITLGNYFLSRLLYEEQTERRADKVKKYQQSAKEEFEKSLLCEPKSEICAKIYLTLAKLYFLDYQFIESCTMLEKIKHLDEYKDEFNTEISKLLAAGWEILKPFAFFVNEQGKPEYVQLPKEKRGDIEKIAQLFEYLTKLSEGIEDCAIHKHLSEYYCAKALQILDKRNISCEWFKKAYYSAPSNHQKITCCTEYCEDYLCSGKKDESKNLEVVKIAREALEQSTDDNDLLKVNLGMVLLYIGNLDEAEALFLEAEKNGKNNLAKPLLEITRNIKNGSKQSVQFLKIGCELYFK